MSRIPGILGNSAPPADDGVQQQLRDLQQQISDLVTARQLQASETSAIVPASYNGSTDGLTFAGGGARVVAHQGVIAAPITCSQVIVHVVVTAGDTGGGGLFVSALIRNDNEAVGDPNTLSEEIASEVINYASPTTSYVRVLPGMSAGAHVTVGVRVGSQTAGSAGNGNGHVSALVVFVR